MRIKILLSIALSAMLAVVSGCVRDEAGTHTAGVPTKDSFTSKYEKPVSQVVNATREVLQRNGKLIIDNVVDHSFQAKVNQHNVWVKVRDLDGRITQVTVQARGSVSADLNLAEEIDKQIGMQLVVPAKE